MHGHPEIQLQIAYSRANDLLVEAAGERLADEARRAAPNFIPSSRWRDAAFWTALVGPIVGLGFLTYFAQEIARAAIH